MQRIILVFGLLSGAIVSLVMSISMLTIYQNPSLTKGSGSMIVGYLSMIIAFALIYVAVKKYRDQHQNGVISFGRAFTIGLFIALIASTLYVVTWAIVYHVFIPDFMDIYTAHMVEEAASGTPKEIEQTAAQVKQYKELYQSPLLFALMTYAEILPVGLIVSLITAAVLKRSHASAGVI
jgi:hypothetical protein